MEDKRINVFISYSHKDNDSEKGVPYINDFLNYMNPLKEKYAVEFWWDNNISGGDDIGENISENIEKADIICLFISPNFLSSKACMKEKDIALNQKATIGTFVLPIIISECEWKEYPDISRLKILPTDAKPLSVYKDINDAWSVIFEDIKSKVETVRLLKETKVVEDTLEWLNSAEILEKSHGKKERIFLEDIFIPPEFDLLDKEGGKDEFKIMSMDDIVKDIVESKPVIISGDKQSGKTSLAKMVFKRLRENNFIPVYIRVKENQNIGKIENRIKDYIVKNYINGKQLLKNKYFLERVVLIIDDFYLTKVRYLDNILRFPRILVFVDDIFRINPPEKYWIKDLRNYRIREMDKVMVSSLVKKWIYLSDNQYEPEDIYREVELRVESIEEILGRVIGNGIMPAYPFFILTYLFIMETGFPLQNVTSQGYLYQVLIQGYLKRAGVRDDYIEIFDNFLTELSYFMFNNKIFYVKEEKMLSFIDDYKRKFNLPLRIEELKKGLRYLLAKDSFGNYRFEYKYIYYFFAGKYMAENYYKEEIQKEVSNMINNLHVEENAYIVVFINHHYKNADILKNLKLNAEELFDDFREATLNKEDMAFFDERISDVVNISFNKIKDSDDKEMGKSNNIDENHKKWEEREDEIARELRRAIRTIEVMGRILKNRGGSLDRNEVREIFEKGMKVHLRIMESFLELIKDEENQNVIIEFIVNVIKNKLEKKEEEKKRYSGKILLKNYNIESLKEYAKKLFWNINFGVFYGIIYKTITSLGSNKIYYDVQIVCDEIGTPAADLIKKGIFMRYGISRIDIEEIKNSLQSEDFSDVSKYILRYLIYDYASKYPISYKDRQRLEKVVGGRLPVALEDSY